MTFSFFPGTCSISSFFLMYVTAVFIVCRHNVRNNGLLLDLCRPTVIIWETAVFHWASSVVCRWAWTTCLSRRSSWTAPRRRLASRPRRRSWRRRRTVAMRTRSFSLTRSPNRSKQRYAAHEKSRSLWSDSGRQLLYSLDGCLVYYMTDRLASFWLRSWIDYLKWWLESLWTVHRTIQNRYSTHPRRNPVVLHDRKQHAVDMACTVRKKDSNVNYKEIKINCRTIKQLIYTLHKCLVNCLR